MKNIIRLIEAFLMTIVFVVWTVLIKTLDLGQAKEVDTTIGFSTFNNVFHTVLPYNQGWYVITQIFGYIAILVVVVLFIGACIQWYQRKNLFKVDYPYFCLAGLYFTLFVLYVLFEQIPINYRPMMMEGETELAASYPSSHTMLVIVVFGSVWMIIKTFTYNKKVILTTELLSFVLITLMVIGRCFSGVHWFTDILGAIFVSCSLLLWFRFALRFEKRKANIEQKERVE